MYKILFAIMILFSSFSTWTFAEDAKKPAKTSYDLPREEVLEYRALQAEERALRAEANQGLKEIEAKRSEILEKWKALTGEKDLSAWQVDFERAKLIKKNGGPPK